MRTPRVSVGLPVFNGEKFLPVAIDSLLAQTFGDFELIISDNASHDNTEAICREYELQDSRIRYFRSHSNRGAAWNFNRAYNLSSANYFKWAAHDDVHHPEFLDSCIALLDSNSDCVLSFCDVEFIDESGSMIRKHQHPINFLEPDLCRRFFDVVTANHIVTEIFGVIRRSALQSTSLIGAYYASDRVLLGQLVLRGRFMMVPKPLFLHREHLDRSSHAPTVEAYTTWFDSRKTDVIVLPSWRLLGEHARSVVSSRQSFAVKLRLLLKLARATYWAKDRLLSEIGYATRRLLGRRT